ncbi:MAG: DegT/DnrJ/EryC1/StrS family aminotransferase [Candidatus Hodarchaeales archaeon]
MKRQIPVAQPQIDSREIDNVIEVLNSGHLAEGRFNRELERSFKDYTGAKHAITVVNGTAALHLALEATGFKPGDEIITSAFTFIASANSISMIGAIPKFADIDPGSWTLDPDSIRQHINERTRGIMPVHIFGLTSDMSAIMEIAEEYNLHVIEDAAQSHGGRMQKRHSGTFGLAGCFSLFATKNMMAGEGGLITTDDKEIADKCKMIKNHGRAISEAGGYMHYNVGYNLRMTDITAAIGVAQLEKLPKFLEKRKRNAKIYTDELSGCQGIELQEIKDGFEHAYYIMGLVTDRRKPQEIIEILQSKGIGSRTIYDVPVYNQPAYQNINEWRWTKAGIKYPDYTQVKLPVTEKIAKSHFEIPVHPGVSEETAQMIAGTLKNILKE